MNFSSAEQKRLMDKYGPWAVVTGATSGIGRELAVRLAEAGMNLVLTARRERVLEELAAELQAAHGIQTLVAPTDVSTPQGVEDIVRAAENVKVGLLVAAAGFGTSGRFLESSLGEELNMIQVNCSALMALTHRFGRLFARQKRGGIILLSSMVGFQGVPYAAHYAATKAYVQSLGEALAVELRSHGVHVLAAAPGPVNTEFAERADMRMGNALEPSAVGIPILRALGRKSTILPGFLTKFLTGSLATLPRWGKVRMMGVVMGGMTKHQRI
ncbi:MAG: SDR family oxidoreductase [Acidobacteriota bacterium]|nr:SDR family oxidoreductase [Acidobacteriota bacterium]